MARNYTTGAMAIAKYILYENRGQSNQALANKIYKKVKRKYYWRNWFVVVYDPNNGFDNHYIGHCDGSSEFDIMGTIYAYQATPRTPLL